MVTLDKIYTRSGDEGETGIGDGSRVSKLNARIVAGGSVDETNSLLGMAASQSSAEPLVSLLQQLQQQLFDLGADISCPWDPEATEDRCPRVSEKQIDWLELQIDTANTELSPLKSFVLPGGTAAAATLHLARTVCRRAEVDVIRLQQEVTINPKIAIFLNRLSDLLFVLARAANDNGKTDILWEPGRAVTD